MPFFVRIFEKKLDDLSSVIQIVNKLTDDLKPKTKERRKK